MAADPRPGPDPGATAAADPPEIRRGGLDDLERIGPLWQSLQAHHLAVSSVDLPPRDPLDEFAPPAPESVGSFA